MTEAQDQEIKPAVEAKPAALEAIKLEAAAPMKADAAAPVKVEAAPAATAPSKLAVSSTTGSAMIAAALEVVNSRKRPSDATAAGAGPVKRPQLANTPGLMVVKLVCPDSKAGAVIGKGGSYIKAIREQTGADVLVEKSIPGTPDRIVQLSSGPAPIGLTTTLSPAQSALLMVVSKIVDDDTPAGRPPPQHVEFRLLVDRAASLAVMGASGLPQGAVLNDIRHYCGATVIVSPPAGRPTVATSNEELIKVAGSLDSVREALRVVTDRIRDYVRGVRPAPLPAKPHAAAAGLPHGYPHVLPPGTPAGAPPGVRPAPLRPNGPAPPPAPPPPGVRPPGPPGALGGIPVETEYRLVVLDNKIGCILGKGGQLAKTIREQTGSDMRIERAAPGAVDRLVVCVSSEAPESDFCAAADALMVCLDKLVQDHVTQATRGTAPGGAFRAMLLVRASHTPVVMARGGSTLIQISTETRARVSLLPREAVPRCAEPGDSALLAEGTPDCVLAAVRAVSIVLRGCQVREHLGLPQVDGSGAPLAPPPGAMPPPPPQRMLSAGPPPVAGPPPPPPKAPGSRPDDQINSAVQRFLTTLAAQQAGAGVPPGARPPVPAYGPPQPTPPAYNGLPPAVPPSGRAPLVTPTLPAGSAPRTSGTAAGAAQNIGGVVRVTMTVMQSQASALLGKGGATISQIRSASGAKIKLHDQPTISGERELEITGTAEQATAARNMISGVIGGAPPPPVAPPAAQPTPTPATHHQQHPAAPVAAYGAPAPYGQQPTPYSYGQAPQQLPSTQQQQPQHTAPPSYAAVSAPPAYGAVAASPYYPQQQQTAPPAPAATAPQSYQQYAQAPQPAAVAQAAPQQPQYDAQYAAQYAAYYAQQQQQASAASAQPTAAVATTPASQYAPTATQQYAQQQALTAPQQGQQAQYTAQPQQASSVTAASQQEQYAAYQLQVQQYNAAVLAQQQAAAAQQQPSAQQQQQPSSQQQQQSQPPSVQQQYGGGAAQQYSGAVAQAYTPAAGQQYAAAGQQYTAPAQQQLYAGAQYTQQPSGSATQQHQHTYQQQGYQQQSGSGGSSSAPSYYGAPPPPSS